MEIRRTNKPKNRSLRQELENFVVSCNKCLKEVVGKMNAIILLRNAHPIYRPDFARKLKEAGMITEEQAKEFIRFVR
jgi:hypothetical protein